MRADAYHEYHTLQKRLNLAKIGLTFQKSVPVVLFIAPHKDFSSLKLTNFIASNWFTFKTQTSVLHSARDMKS